MSDLTAIMEAAKSLSFEERTQLVESLVAMDSDQAEWDPQLLAEIERRSREYHEGQVQLKSWEDVKASAWQRLEKHASR
jgi:putative addiction module component (TIGR02574 family)